MGPRLGSSPVHSITQCLARKIGTNNFYTLKVVIVCSESVTVITNCHVLDQMLTLKPLLHESQDEKQGKMLLMTEYSLLSLLHDQPGVIHHHGLFKVKQVLKENSQPKVIDLNTITGSCL